MDTAFSSVPKSTVFYVNEGSYAESWVKKAGYKYEYTNGKQSVKTPAAKGTKFNVAKLKATFIVTSSNTTNSTVEYKGTTNKKAASVTIPKTITVDGVTYKVTSIANKAFSGNKNIKKVTVGVNVASIGKNAFKNINKNATIKVPQKQYSKYKKKLSKKTGYQKSMKIKKS